MGKSAQLEHGPVIRISELCAHIIDLVPPIRPLGIELLHLRGALVETCIAAAAQEISGSGERGLDICTGSQMPMQLKAEQHACEVINLPQG